MKRPERVRVLGKRVSVTFVTPGDDVLKGDDGIAGLAINDPNKQSVWISDGMPLESEQDAMLHEVIHLIEAWMDIDLSEQAVTKLATGLLAVIKDNPSFWRYLAARK